VKSRITFLGPIRLQVVLWDRWGWGVGLFVRRLIFLDGHRWNVTLRIGPTHLTFSRR
jgi:hypothetical protein